MIKCKLDLSNLREITIEEGCFQDKMDILELCNLPNVETIVVKKQSLVFVNTLKICNNEQLKNIVVEDGDRYQQNDQWYSDAAFLDTKDLTLASTITTSRN